jgi:hypothetical protein
MVWTSSGSESFAFTSGSASSDGAADSGPGKLFQGYFKAAFAPACERAAWFITTDAHRATTRQLREAELLRSLGARRGVRIGLVCEQLPVALWPKGRSFWKPDQETRERGVLAIGLWLPDIKTWASLARLLNANECLSSKPTDRKVCPGSRAVDRLSGAGL